MKKIAIALSVVSSCAAFPLVLLRLAGASDYVSVISGTLPGSPVAALMGVLYAAAWFSAVLAAPTLLLAATFVALIERFTRAPLAIKAGAASPARSPA